MPLCGWPLATDPSRVSSLWAWLIFVPLSTEPIHCYSVSLSPSGLAAFECHMNCYQKLPQYLGKLKYNYLFSTASCVCEITWCIAISVEFLVYRQIGIAVHGHKPSDLSLICLATNFFIIFFMQNSRLIGWYPIASVQLAFPGAGISVILTCPQARQASICTYLWYFTTDFDTLRTSCLFP